MYIIELEKGVWVTKGQGDPPRTLVKENASRFTTDRKALIYLNRIRKVYPRKGWKEAKIYGVIN